MIDIKIDPHNDSVTGIFIRAISFALTFNTVLPIIIPTE
jgi:hypothetical protein